MDLSAINHNETSVLKVLHPVSGEVLTTDTGEEMFLEIAGHGSTAYKKAIFDFQREAITKGVNVSDFEWTQERSVSVVARLVVSWRVQVDGEVLPCTVPNVTAVFNRFPWLMDEAEAFARRRENFFKS